MTRKSKRRGGAAKSRVELPQEATSESISSAQRGRVNVMGISCTRSLKELIALGVNRACSFSSFGSSVWECRA